MNIHLIIIIVMLLIIGIILIPFIKLGSMILILVSIVIIIKSNHYEK